MYQIKGSNSNEGMESGSNFQLLYTKSNKHKI